MLLPRRGVDVQALEAHIRAKRKTAAECRKTAKQLRALAESPDSADLLADCDALVKSIRTMVDKIPVTSKALQKELVVTQQQGYGVDNEEFLPGLLCVAVLVPSASGRSNLCVAVQAPVMRLTPDKALGLLPALHRAADALSRIERDSAAPLDDRESA